MHLHTRSGTTTYMKTEHMRRDRGQGASTTQIAPQRGSAFTHPSTHTETHACTPTHPHTHPPTHALAEFCSDIEARRFQVWHVVHNGRSPQCWKHWKGPCRPVKNRAGATGRGKIIHRCFCDQWLETGGSIHHGVPESPPWHLVR